MIIWAIIGFAILVAVVIWYWYKPEVFKVHPEKKYPENYSKHPDPHQYKGYR
jgi:hypothetical protein